MRANANRGCDVAGDAVGGKDLDRTLPRDDAHERALEIGVLDHVRAGFARPQFVIEAKQRWTTRGIDRAVGNLDAGDGFSVPRKLRPNAENREEAFARGR